MLEIAFNLEQSHTSWKAKIHQLNGDVLRRHVLPKLHSDCYLIDFQYCEKTLSGTILCDSGSKLGSFTVK
ncbi:hypothetical protein ATG66_0306 [Vibrio sp. ES.051]|uniref:hypothetical protein n=1 Tax=Vibrio sp. ES.051 TaxID=1761909 RepID=UPI000BF52A8F|nr:hypothetical protein [Vibrio sp. ES.051]PFG57809.1 hypothetical protein ATG66_0306 [Vibrio sp. ES.051]